MMIAMLSAMYDHDFVHNCAMILQCFYTMPIAMLSAQCYENIPLSQCYNAIHKYA